MSASVGQPACIELRLESIAHLFDPFDPFPLPSRDLAKGAEDFITGWARELPHDAPIEIVIHLPRSEAESDAAKGLQDAIARHFAYRAERVGGDVHELFRVGRLSLAIGLAVLVLCVAGGRILIGAFGDTPLTRVLAEGLSILGWVANWRPIEIFLYDWWPLLQRRRLLQRIAGSPVSIQQY
ncbi:MAG: hypothetical protein JSS00_00965 [Proteobacteria bacterium]|nr:hypothetical protein [Pseudomonadota bacterium]